MSSYYEIIAPCWLYRLYASYLIGSVGGVCMGGKRSVAKLPLVGLIRYVVLCFPPTHYLIIHVQMGCYFLEHFKQSHTMKLQLSCK